jgi:two-component system OmpR family response regulator
MYTILLVDDDSAIRDIFTIFLERAGYTVHAVPGGEEALALLQTITPDLIILDIMMQPMDGWETLTAIRNNTATRDLPVTMFSGKAPTQEEIMQYSGWIEDYLMKPMNFKTIAESLTSIIELSGKMRMEREHLAKEGSDRQMIDEYYHLKKSLFNIRKFSRFLMDSREGNEHTIRVLEEQLSRVRSILGIP